LNQRAQRAFCYFGLLKFADDMELIVALLPQEDRSAVHDLLAELQQFSGDEIKQRFLIELDEEARIERQRYGYL
jgi:hypothetical protein